MLLRSIRSRLLGLVLATVIPFAALIGGGLWSQLHSDQARALERALNEARLLAAQVDDHIGNVENLLTGLSRAVSTDPADTASNDAMLRRVKSELPNFISRILLFSLDGTNIGTSDTTDVAADKRVFAGNRAYFHEVLAGKPFTIGDLLPPEIAGRWVLTAAVPVRDADGRLRGVLAMGTRLERFQEVLRVHQLPGGSVVRIVNQDGIVIAQNPNQEWIGRNLSMTKEIARSLAAKETSEVALWPDQVWHLTGSSTAHRAPWLISVGLPTDIGFAAMKTRLTWGAIFSAISLGAAFAIAWMLSGRIVGPLRQLQHDAIALAAGDLSHRTEVKTDDEVGKLADTFNGMAASLERRQIEAQESKNTLSAIIDASPVAIACTGLDRRIVLWNRAAEKLYEYAADEVVGHEVLMVPPEGKAESVAIYEQAIRGETIRDREVKRRRKSGALVDVRLAAAPMYGPDGAVRGVAWAHEDITDRKRAEEQLKRLAHYDPLTGLPNRLSLQKELGRLLAGDGYNRPVAVALFDLDGFKDVNDTLGHSTGDRLLIEVGQRFVDAAESSGRLVRVFRLGGDEFVLVVPDCGDPRVVGEIVEGVLRRLTETFAINDQALHLGSSAGIAVAPNDGVTVDELIANADLALYQAKSGGGRTYRFFMPVLRAQAQSRRGLDLELRRAYAEGEFEVHYQPQVRLTDGAVVGAEALLRWRHPQRGILAPGAFIDTLAESAIAPDIGRWIVRTACASAAAWRGNGHALSRIGINLFPIQLSSDALLQDIDDALRETGLPADAVELEITENIALHYEDAVGALEKLRDKGVSIAFDDFGTGYASLSYLTRFPLSRIKIDRSFVLKITENAGDAAIVRSLIAMAHNLGLAVIAEGVETQAQAAFLIEEHCEEAQGFLYSKPLPAADFEDYLKAQQLAHDAGAEAMQRVTRVAAAGRSARPSARRRPPLKSGR